MLMTPPTFLHVLQTCPAGRRRFTPSLSTLRFGWHFCFYDMKHPNSSNSQSLIIKRYIGKDLAGVSGVGPEMNNGQD